MTQRHKRDCVGPAGGKRRSQLAVCTDEGDFHGTLSSAPALRRPSVARFSIDSANGPHDEKDERTGCLHRPKGRILTSKSPENAALATNPASHPDGPEPLVLGPV